MRPIDRLALGIIAAVDRFHAIAPVEPGWEPTPQELLSIIKAFVDAAKVGS